MTTVEDVCSSPTSPVASVVTRMKEKIKGKENGENFTQTCIIKSDIFAKFNSPNKIKM
jgi:hypothetical protein